VSLQEGLLVTVRTRVESELQNQNEGGPIREHGNLVSVELDANCMVAVVELSDPARRNMLSIKLLHDLRNAVNDLRRERSLCAIVLQGAGDQFCCCEDPEIITNDQALHKVSVWEEEFVDTMGDLQSLGVPIVCAMQGEVGAGGLLVCQMADYRVADAHTTFQLAVDSQWMFSVQMVVGTMLAQLLPKAVGVRSARRMLAQNSLISSAAAVELGVLDEVCAGVNEAKARARHFAHQLSQYSTVGIRNVLQLTRVSLPVPDISNLRSRWHVESARSCPPDIMARSNYSKHITVDCSAVFDPKSLVHLLQQVCVDHVTIFRSTFGSDKANSWYGQLGSLDALRLCDMLTSSSMPSISVCEGHTQESFAFLTHLYRSAGQP